MSERAPRRDERQLTLPASAILATTEIPLTEALEAGVLAGATYVPNAAITGANSPASRRLTIINKGQSGAGTTVMATLDFISGVNGVAFDEKDFTLSGTAANLVVASGDILSVKSEPIGGTGLVDPGGQVRVQIQRY